MPVFILYAPNLPDKGGILKSFTMVVVLASFSFKFPFLFINSYVICYLEVGSDLI